MIQSWLPICNKKAVTLFPPNRVQQSLPIFIYINLLLICISYNVRLSDVDRSYVHYTSYLTCFTPYVVYVVHCTLYIGLPTPYIVRCTLFIEHIVLYAVRMYAIPRVQAVSTHGIC
jgi:hypothetical protein